MMVDHQPRSSPGQNQPLHPMLGSAADTLVTISPSHQIVRKADPSLSFQVVAQGMRYFDVIVATDPALFTSENVHIRTPKNFHSSRQSFQGEPIEMETGFYMLPRSYIQNLTTMNPRPSRLYYIAVAYPDVSAQQSYYSLHPSQITKESPFVGLAADLLSANLSKIMGISLDRLGVVSRQGQIIRAQPENISNGLPAEVNTPLPNDNQTFMYGSEGYVQQAEGREQPAQQVETVPSSPPEGVITNISDTGPAEEAAPAKHTDDQESPSCHASNESSNTPDVGNGASANGYTIEADDFVDDDNVNLECESYNSSQFLDYDEIATNIEEKQLEPHNEGFSDAPDSAVSVGPDGPPIPPMDPSPAAANAPYESNNQVNDPVSVPKEASWKEALLEKLITSGVGGRYDALNLDGAFRGRFGQNNPYYKRAHQGLSYGLMHANQDSGELGELLMAFRSADQEYFSQIFGRASDALITITNSEGPQSLEMADGRSPRVKPIEGSDLWEEPWVTRFRNAAEFAPFKAAQRSEVLAKRLDPIMPIAEALHLSEVPAIGLFFALTINMGVEAALSAFAKEINPLDTPAKVAAALEALGHAKLESFQQAAGVEASDTLTPPTIVAFLSGLAKIGDASPVQIPGVEAMLDSLMDIARSLGIGDAVAQLRQIEATPNTNQNGKQP